jgi:hypothetical protein
MTIVEATAALMVLAAGFVATAQVLVACGRQRATSDQLLAAQFEAANVSEQIAAMSFDDLNVSRLAELKISAASQKVLPGGYLKITVRDAKSDEDADAASASNAETGAASDAKRVRIEVRWPIDSANAKSGLENESESSEADERQVALTIWKYAAVEGKP